MDRGKQNGGVDVDCIVKSYAIAPNKIYKNKKSILKILQITKINMLF
ncbi:MAG: hypothetical protein IJT23_09200 [Clostridia bacterium]|nr:hypothetical protein [Clostridia bacterium]